MPATALSGQANRLHLGPPRGLQKSETKWEMAPSISQKANGGAALVWWHRGEYAAGDYLDEADEPRDSESRGVSSDDLRQMRRAHSHITDDLPRPGYPMALELLPWWKKPYPPKTWVSPWQNSRPVGTTSTGTVKRRPRGGPIITPALRTPLWASQGQTFQPQP